MIHLLRKELIPRNADLKISSQKDPRSLGFRLETLKEEEMSLVYVRLLAEG